MECKDSKNNQMFVDEWSKKNEVKSDRKLQNSIKWISVEEQLPENHDILIVTDGKTTTISAYDHGFMFTMLPYIEIVTHWMPLPSPPNTN